MNTRAAYISGVKKPLNQVDIPIYSDFNTGFWQNPDTGDIARITNVNAVKKALKNLVMTDKYERPFRPDYGCGIRSLLFENMTGATLSIIKDTIKECIQKYEPRVSITEVLVQGKENAVEITIAFQILNIKGTQTLQITVDRAR